LEIATEAENWYISHGKRDIRTVKIRMKRLIKEFGSQPADRISPARIDLWISKQDWSPATCNRYKALLSKTFKLALAAGKVAINPARLVEQRTESAGRIRYLLPDEELQLRKVINRRFPNHDPALTVALRTGMRKGEQLSGVNYSFRRTTTISPYERQLPDQLLTTFTSSNGEAAGGGGRSPEPEAASPLVGGRTISSPSAWTLLRACSSL
jgi:hypothetical protein